MSGNITITLTEEEARQLAIGTGTPRSVAVKAKAALPLPIVWHETPIGMRVAQVGDRVVINSGASYRLLGVDVENYGLASTQEGAEAWLRGAQ